MKKLVLLFVSVLSTSQAFASNYTFNPYGFLLLTSTTSTAGLESFSQGNYGAPTAAANPGVNANANVVSHPNWPGTSFQAAQSRFGLNIKHNELPVEGLVEFDFIDFAKSSPTVAALPRLRRATMTYVIDQTKVVVGQDWDLVSPLAPTTFNLVGHYFQTGDLGFMRQQIQVLNTQDRFEHALAIGTTQANNTAYVNQMEYGVYPTLALRETFTDGGLKVGLSALAGVTRLPTDQRKQVGGYVATAFISYKSAAWTTTAEAYEGQNLANLNLQGLSFSSTGRTVKEFGGYISSRFQASEKVGIFGGMGLSKVENPNAVVPAWNYSASSFSFANFGPGLKQNGTVRLGASYEFIKQNNLFIELGHFMSEFALNANQIASQYSPTRNASYLEFGLKTDF